MPFLHRFSAIVLTFVPMISPRSAHGQAASGGSPTPALVTHNTELPSAPQPQSKTSPQDPQKPSGSSAPSLQDLGLSPDQTRADLDAQRRLDRRSHDLKVHQTLGLVTLVPIAAACITSGLAPPDPRSGNNDTGRDIHVALGSASVALYGATAFYAIRAPRIPGQGPTRGGIKLHKYLVAIHAPGMLLTPILGAMAYNQAANGQKVTGIASAHAAVALITAGAYAGSIIAVSWPLRFPGHHHDSTRQVAIPPTTGDQE